MDASRTIVLACATVIEEILPLIPAGMAQRVFDFGLHVNPGKLRTALQAAIDEASADHDTVLLGYGLCSQALVGIHAGRCRLVAPRVDDCIALFLGSRQAYLAQGRGEPGTFYLTKGWIEAGDTPFSDYDRSVQRYGKAKADAIYRIMMDKYKRLALIDTGVYELENYRQLTRDTAAQFGLRFEEIAGSDRLVRKLLHGPWDEEIVVLEPGGTFTLEDFLPMLAGKP
jgi:hypothetical protein